MEKNENKTKFGEKVSLTIRKRWLINGSKTFLIVAILIAAYIAINLFVKSLDLPEFDVTANKLYTLSDASKKVIERNGGIFENIYSNDDGYTYLRYWIKI